MKPVLSLSVCRMLSRVNGKPALIGLVLIACTYIFFKCEVMEKVIEDLHDYWLQPQCIDFCFLS